MSLQKRDTASAKAGPRVLIGWDRRVRGAHQGKIGKGRGLSLGVPEEGSEGEARGSDQVRLCWTLSPTGLHSLLS